MGDLQGEGAQGERAMGALILLVNIALVAFYIGIVAYVVLKPRMQRPRGGSSPAASMLRRAAAKLCSASDAAQGTVVRALSSLAAPAPQWLGPHVRAAALAARPWRRKHRRARGQEHAA
jgi:hypothetical protein